jgi:ATP-dependent DNA ligase
MADIKQILYETPTLQKDGTRSKQFWKSEVVELENGDIGHRTDSWSLKQNGEESKHRISKVTIAEAKNVGQANERGPKEQAISEINSKADKKQDKRYWPVGEEKPDFRVMPMSAKKYGTIDGGEFKPKRGPDRMDFPAYVQPKLDGVRMLFDGEIGWSRKLKTFGDHVSELFEDVHLGGEMYLDGELMLPPNEHSFQETVSAVKREQDLSEKLRFYVFDLYAEDEPGKPFEKRLQLMKGWFSALSSNGIIGNDAPIEIVPTTKAAGHDEVLEAHAKYVKQGHEGTMVRSASGSYKDATTRSGDLLKLKGFTDKEFEIVGAREGKGKFQGMAVFICASENGEFEVTPKGTEKERARLFEDREQIVGKDLTVRFQNLTEDGLPRFPVGLGIRDYE